MIYWCVRHNVHIHIHVEFAVTLMIFLILSPAVIMKSRQHCESKKIICRLDDTTVRRTTLYKHIDKLNFITKRLKFFLSIPRSWSLLSSCGMFGQMIWLLTDYYMRDGGFCGACYGWLKLININLIFYFILKLINGEKNKV